MTRWRTRIYYSLPPGCVSSGEISLGNRQPQSKSDNFISHEYRAILWTELDSCLPAWLPGQRVMDGTICSSGAFLLTQPEGTCKIRNSIFSTWTSLWSPAGFWSLYRISTAGRALTSGWVSRTPGLWTDTGDRNGPNPHATRTAIELSIGRGWRYLFVSTGWPAVQCVIQYVPCPKAEKNETHLERALSFERRTGHGIKVISFGFNPQLVSHFNWTGDSYSNSTQRWRYNIYSGHGVMIKWSSFKIE